MNCKYTTLLSNYSDVFNTGNKQPVRGVKAKIYVPSDAKPLYYKAIPIQYALREKIDKEIDRLLAEGIIVTVPHSDFQ